MECRRNGRGRAGVEQSGVVALRVLEGRISFGNRMPGSPSMTLHVDTSSTLRGKRSVRLRYCLTRRDKVQTTTEPL